MKKALSISLFGRYSKVSIVVIRFVVLAIIFCVCILPSSAESTERGENIEGLKEMEKSIKKIAVNSYQSDRKFEDSVFPTWKLSYKDNSLEVGKKFKLFLNPKGAFTISPESVEIKHPGQAAFFTVTLTEPEKMLNPIGEIKDLDGFIRIDEEVDAEIDTGAKFDFSSSWGINVIEAPVVTNNDQLRDDFQSSQPPAEKLGRREFTFWRSIDIYPGSSLIVFLGNNHCLVKSKYNLSPGYAAVYLSPNAANKGLKIRHKTKVYATDWDDREDASCWTYYFDNDPWLDKIVFVRGSYKNSVRDFKRKVSSLIKVEFSN